mmetsp:Transcript_107560/g.185458  ORF Transcript_107560/g.185458 Transcript_107560/m.185458 type:complete len:286 (-) Transcript_107560:1403-2260(-)
MELDEEEIGPAPRMQRAFMNRGAEHLCPEYFDTISRHLLDFEKRHRPSNTYIQDVQQDVSAQMRAILVDWLNEVTEEFSLKIETLCLSVNYVDRYLSRVHVQRNRLQLVGVTCMLIASKTEEIMPPSVDDFVYITDNTYGRDEVLKMELAILIKLEFCLTATTPRDFVGIYLHVAQADRLVCMLTDYLVELTLQDYAFLKYPPSMVAVAAVVMALHTSHERLWSEALSHYTQYPPHELNDCLRDMHRCYVNAPSDNLQAVRDKYSHYKFMRVSTRVLPPAHPPMF